MAKVAVRRTPGIRAYWPLNEATGNTLVDSLGVHDGTARNSPPSVAGKVGTARQFVGATSKDASIPDHADFAPGSAGAFTWSFWYQRRAAGSGASEYDVISKGSGTYPFNLYQVDQRLQFRLSDGTNTPVVYPSGYNSLIYLTAPLNKWQHVAVVRDTAAGLLRLYHEGWLRDSVTDTTTGTVDNTADVYLIRQACATNAGLDIYLDDLRYYREARSAADILSAYLTAQGISSRTRTELAAGGAMRAIDVVPGTGTLIGTQSDGIYRSTNGGANWTKVQAYSTGGFYDMVYVDQAGSIFVSDHDGDTSGDIYRSTDDGATWTVVFTGTQPFSQGFTEKPSSNVRFFGEYPPNGSDPDLYKSTDGGATWSAVYTFTGYRHIHACRMDPYTSRLYVSCGDGPSGIFYSDDDGATFTEIAAAAGMKPTSIVFGSGYRLFGSDGSYNIHKTTDDVNVTEVWAGDGDQSLFFSATSVGTTHFFSGSANKVGSRPFVLYTADGGTTWVRIHQETPAEAVNDGTWYLSPNSYQGGIYGTPGRDDTNPFYLKVT